MKLNRKLALLLAASCVIVVTNSRAEQGDIPPPPQSIIATVLEKGESMTVDANMAAPAWRRAPVFGEFVEHSPQNGRHPLYETRVRVVVAQDAIFVGVNALDPHPEQIREQLVRHDLVRRTQDFIALYINSMGQRNSAQWFRVGASGSTTDGLYTEADDSEDLSPDFDWDSDVKRTTEGYNVVFRIPFTTLRYVGNSSAPWRIMVARRVPRDEIYELTSMYIADDSRSYISHMQPLEGVKTPPGDSFLIVRPNVTLRRQDVRPDRGSDSASTGAQVGVDVKWRPFSEAVVDATFHPDFSQVAFDTPQLTRDTTFAVYYPEKRAFFLESSDLLKGPTIALSTRTVTDPAWGARATLRYDEIAGTAFVAEDNGGGVVLLPGPYATNYANQPASKVAAGRFRLDHDSLEIGGVASIRRFVQGAGENTVVGPDGSLQLTDALRLRGQFLVSDTTAQIDGSGALALTPSRRGYYGYANAFWKTDAYEASASLDSVSGSFRDDNGFFQQAGVDKQTGYLNRILRNIGPLNELTFSLMGQYVQERRSHTTVSGYLTPAVYISTSNDTQLSAEYHGLSLVRSREGGPLMRERYCHVDVSRNFGTAVPNASLSADVGRIADVVADEVRPGTRVTLSATLRPLARLETDVNLSEASLRADGQTTYLETASQLLAVYHFSPSQSLRLIAQHTLLDRRAETGRDVSADHERQLAGSITYTWRKNAGTTVYVGVTNIRNRLIDSGANSKEIYAKVQMDLGDFARDH